MADNERVNGDPGQRKKPLSASQSTALKEFSSFVGSDDEALIVTGAAGTGKTSLLREFVQVLEREGIPYALMAPTGRAARVISERISRDASTIHRAIYAFDRLVIEYAGAAPGDPDADKDDPRALSARAQYRFNLRKEPRIDHEVLIVDEASMVGDSVAQGEVFQFGSGRLLADLVSFVFRPPSTLFGQTRTKRKLVLVGDPFQLRPINDTRVPALDADYLKSEHGLAKVRAVELHEVMRQKAGGVLDLASEIRAGLNANNYTVLRLNRPSADVEVVPDSSLLDRFEGIVVTQGDESAVMVVANNAEALRLNRSIRERRHRDAGLPPMRGDRIIITQNCPMTGLMNGQFCRIVSASAEVERRMFRDITLSFRDIKIEAELAQGKSTQFPVKIFDHLLSSHEPGLIPEEVGALHVDFYLRHKGVGPEERARLAMNDLYVNALQVKYGWAVTCHKAQGGEWEHVFASFKGPQGNEGAFRWAYTAVTRSSRMLYLTNPPNFGPGSEAAEEMKEASHDRENALSLIVQMLERSGYHLVRHVELVPGVRVEIEGPDPGLSVVDVFLDARGYLRGFLPLRATDEVPAELGRLLSRLTGRSVRPKGTPENMPPTIQRFIEALRANLEAAGASILDITHHDYHFVVTMIDDSSSERAVVTLYYKANGKISRATPKLGSRAALVAAIRKTLEQL